MKASADIPRRDVHSRGGNPQEALHAAKEHIRTEDPRLGDPDWDGSILQRIVHIEDETGNTLAHDIPLDDFLLRNDGERGRRLCEASQEILRTLQLAKNPHWVHNAGITHDIEALRRICIYHAEWWNSKAWPLIRALSPEPEKQGEAALTISAQDKASPPPEYTIGTQTDGGGIAILRTATPIATLIAAEAEAKPLVRAANCHQRLLDALKQASAAIEEATDVMSSGEDGSPVTLLRPEEIEHAYLALCGVMVQIHEAIIAGESV